MRRLKLISVGESNVGKTSFVRRFADQTWIASGIATIGIDFKIRTVGFKGESLKLFLWDTAGAERFRHLSRAYYRGCDGAFLMFSVSDRDSFERITDHHSAMCTHAGDRVQAVLVGLKSDLAGSERKVSFAEAMALAASLRSPAGARLRYMECSSLSGQGIEQVVYALTRDCHRRMAPRPPEQSRLASRRMPSSAWKCCVQ